MKSDKVILVAGGDLRQQYAAQRLRQKTGAAVWTVGLPAQPNLHFAETPAEVPAYDVLVLPVLAGSSGETVPAPFGTSPLSLPELAAQGKPAALVAGGGCSGVAHWFEAAGMTVTDYLRREELCLANAVPTAEGAIRIAMEETARTLHGASALVVGYGRIGMALAPRLRALGMQTEICARRCETRALAQMQGFSAVPVSALAQRAAAADVIFNTVPVLLLSETVLKALPPWSRPVRSIFPTRLAGVRSARAIRKASGARIGANRMIAAPTSITIPTRIKNTFTISRSTILLSEI